MRLLFAVSIFFIFSAVFGSEHTFILQDVDSGHYIIQEGDTFTALSPYSTFKIPLALMGFDSEILEDTENPVWQCKDEYKKWNDSFLERWSTPQTPLSWIQNSCLWYSQVLTQQLGVNAFSDYINLFQYGNKDITGDPDKDNGLTHSWLGSSLRISPLEQLHFINQLITHQLPVSLRAHTLTESVLFVEELPNGMRLYGKTGSGPHAQGQDSDLRVGWFLGWIEKGNKRLSVVYLLKGKNSDRHISGPVAREQFKQRLLQLLI